MKTMFFSQGQAKFTRFWKKRILPEVSNLRENRVTIAIRKFHFVDLAVEVPYTVGDSAQDDFNLQQGASWVSGLITASSGSG